jgi:hypothetical protein
MSRLNFIFCLALTVVAVFCLVMLAAVLTDVPDYMELSTQEKELVQDRVAVGCVLLASPFLWFVLDRRLAYLQWPRLWSLPILAMTGFALLTDRDGVQVLAGLGSLAAYLILFLAPSRLVPSKTGS